MSKSEYPTERLELQALYQISQLIGSALDIKKTLSEVLQSLHETLRMERATLVLQDEGGNGKMFAAFFLQDKGGPLHAQGFMQDLQDLGQGFLDVQGRADELAYLIEGLQFKTFGWVVRFSHVLYPPVGVIR